MAEHAGLPSPRMDWHSSYVPQALRKFKATCELYFSGPLTAKSEEEKISYLLIWSGEEGIELVSTWSLTNEEKKLSTYWKKFEEYVAPKSNFRLARYKLRTLKQEKDDTVDSFLKKVRVLVNECKYTIVDEHIIDALIFGSSRSRVQAKLLEYDATLTLHKAIDIARTEEATSSQLQDIRNTEITVVHALGHNARPKRPQAQPQTKKQLCGNCSTIHDISQRSFCPAQGTKCNQCGKLHHWGKVCRSKKPQGPPKGSRDRQHNKNEHRKQVHTLESDNTSAATTPDRHATTVFSFHRQYVTK